jgi:hypothetical protein
MDAVLQAVRFFSLKAWEVSERENDALRKEIQQYKKMGQQMPAPSFTASWGEPELADNALCPPRQPRACNGSRGGAHR